MLENVVGFLNANKGRDFEQALLALNGLGYRVDTFIIDASDFVPQSRERLFVIGLLENVFPVQRPENDIFGLKSYGRPDPLVSFILKHPQIKWNIRQLPIFPNREQSLEDIIEDLPQDNSMWWNNSRADYLLSQMSPRHRIIADRMIVNHQWSYGTVFRRMRNGKSTAELRTDGIAGCLRTPAGGSAKQILFKAGYNQYFARLLTRKILVVSCLKKDLFLHSLLLAYVNILQYHRFFKFSSGNLPLRIRLNTVPWLPIDNYYSIDPQLSDDEDSSG